MVSCGRLKGNAVWAEIFLRAPTTLGNRGVFRALVQMADFRKHGPLSQGQERGSQCHGRDRVLRSLCGWAYEGEGWPRVTGAPNGEVALFPRTSSVDGVPGGTAARTNLGGGP